MSVYMPQNKEPQWHWTPLHPFPLFFLMFTCLSPCHPTPTKARSLPCCGKCSGASLPSVAQSRQLWAQSSIPSEFQNPSVNVSAGHFLSEGSKGDPCCLTLASRDCWQACSPLPSHFPSVPLCHHVSPHSVSSAFMWYSPLCAWVQTPSFLQ